MRAPELCPNDFFGSVYKLPAQVLVTGSDAAGLCIDNKVEITRKIGNGSPENLPEQSFRAIPYTGTANFSRNRESEPRMAGFVFTIKKDKTYRMYLLPLLIYHPVIGGPDYPMTVGKTLGSFFIH